MSKYSDILDFSKLPLEIRIKILATFNSYSECHVMIYPDGHRTVEVDWYICSDKYVKPHVEHEFKKSDFHPSAIRLGYLLTYGIQPE